MNSDTLRDAALEYAQREWPVLPIQPRGKRPLTRHGVLDATTDTDTINEWWTEHADANVAIATGDPSGVVVVQSLDRTQATGRAQQTTGRAQQAGGRTQQAGGRTQQRPTTATTQRRQLNRSHQTRQRGNQRASSFNRARGSARGGGRRRR